MQSAFEFNIAKSSTSDNQNQNTAVKQQSKMSPITNEMITATSNDLSANDNDTIDQFAPNETILQLVAQIPNHPLQKIAQKLIVDRPRSNSESHSKNANGNNQTDSTISSATSEYSIKISNKCMFFFTNIAFFFYVLLTLGPDIADISRIFFEVIRSELNANQIPEFVIQQKTCTGHETVDGETDVDALANESDFEQDSNQSKRKFHINLFIKTILLSFIFPFYFFLSFIMYALLFMFLFFALHFVLFDNNKHFDPYLLLKLLL